MRPHHRIDHNDVFLQMILTDSFSNSNFSKAQIAPCLMMVIKPKHVGAFLM
jgi:hypothetical protein